MHDRSAGRAVRALALSSMILLLAVPSAESQWQLAPTDGGPAARTARTPTEKPIQDGIGTVQATIDGQEHGYILVGPRGDRPSAAWGSGWTAYGPTLHVSLWATDVAAGEATRDDLRLLITLSFMNDGGGVEAAPDPAGDLALRCNPMDDRVEVHLPEGGSQPLVSEEGCGGITVGGTSFDESSEVLVISGSFEGIVDDVGSAVEGSFEARVPERPSS